MCGKRNKMKISLVGVLIAGFFLFFSFVAPVCAEVKSLRVAYMPYPVHKQQLL